MAHRDGRDIFRAYNAATDSGVSTDDLNKAEDQVMKDRATYKKSYEESVDRAHDNDVIRAPAEDAAKEAGAAFTKAATIGLEIPEMEKNNKQAGADESAESKAEQLHNKSGGAAQVTERERIGLGAASSIQVSILDTAKSSLAVQRELLKSNQTLAKQIYDAGGF